MEVVESGGRPLWAASRCPAAARGRDRRLTPPAVCPHRPGPAPRAGRDSQSIESAVCGVGEESGVGG